VATVKTTPFELRGADGGPLRGDVRTAAGGANRPAVVVAHGFKGFRDWGMFPHLAARLARAGLTTVTFNFSGSGVGSGDSFNEPERFTHDTYTRQLTDLSEVLAALGEARLVPGLTAPTRTGLLGHSRGGAMSILKTAEDHAVRALVTWAAFANVRRWGEETVARWRAEGGLEVVNARTGEVLVMGTEMLDDIERNGAGRLDLAAAAAKIEVPWLIVHGTEDEAVAVQDARVLERASGHKAKTLIIEKAGHTFGAKHPWLGSTPALDMAMDATVSWFSEALL
jgi:pimeloyl-ACP methyl ester carboxylesterase